MNFLGNLFVWGTGIAMITMCITIGFIFWRRVFQDPRTLVSDVYDEKAEEKYMCLKERIFNALFWHGIFVVTPTILYFLAVFGVYP